MKNPPDIPFLPLVSGQAEGELTGGNLTLVASSLGTPMRSIRGGKFYFWKMSRNSHTRLTGCWSSCEMQENSRIALGFCWANGPIAIPLTLNLPFLLAESFKIFLFQRESPYWKILCVAIVCHRYACLSAHRFLWTRKRGGSHFLGNNGILAQR